ncbi:MAG: methyltransferase domain-containing protein [Rhodoferax sp.]|nr:methyltransferase domain-containing protein [Rhodoferax sp.]
MHNLDLAQARPERAAATPWVDALHAKLDRWMTHPRMYRWALSNPLSRWFAVRRTRQLFDLMSGFVYSQVLLSCVRLNLFAIVQKAPATLEELAARTQLPLAALQRLVLSAVSLKLLEPRSGQRYGLGALGAPLAVHEGIRAMVEHNSLLYRDMTEPTDFLRDAWSGHMAAYWPYAHARTPEQVKAADAVDVARYSALMAASQTFVLEQVLSAFPFADYRCVLDVGCGKGRFIAELAARQPQLQFQLFDLPQVLGLARQNHASLGVQASIAYHPGSFFHDELPTGADLVTLIRVAHDHPDEGVRTILRKIFQALPVGGTLMLAEPMAHERGSDQSTDAYFHFYLLAMGAGRLRTPSELAQMLRDCGFVHVELVPNSMPIHTRILIARKPGAANAISPK